MFIKIRCPHCESGLKVRNEFGGRACRCPHCHKTFKVPEPSRILQQPPPEDEEQSQFDFSSSSSDSYQDYSSSYSQSSGAAISGGDASDVSIVLSGIIGLVATVIYMGILYPFVYVYKFADIFWDRGWVPFALTLLMFWSLAILLLKWFKLRKQRDATFFDVLPTEISEEITVDHVDEFLEHLAELPADSDSNLLITRVARGLEHFKVRQSAPETTTMMGLQGEIDYNNVASSYTLIKFFIWALPILGFIGTVMGVSSAVASLAGSLDGAGDMSEMKDALNSVFSGLGIAFDTTLLALVMCIFVKLPQTAMQKSEEDLVTLIDEYCNENLLKRLEDGRAGGAERGASGGPGTDLTPFQEVVESAMATHHSELKKWEQKLQQIGVTISKQVAKELTTIGTDVAEKMTEVAETATTIDSSLVSISENAVEIPARFSETMDQVSESVEGQLHPLTESLSRLNEVLAELGDHQVVIQQVEKKKKGWFR